MEYIFQKREQGVNVSIGMAIKHASKLDRAFKQKGKNAKSLAMHKFIQRNGLVHRMGTHELQKILEQVSGEAMEFMDNMQKILEGPS